MKLLHKTALYLLLAALPIVLGGVFLLRYYIHWDVLHEIDELLISELVQVQERLRQHPPDAIDLPGWDPNVRITLATSAHQPIHAFKDTVAFNPKENEQAPVRMLRATYADGNRY